MKNQAMSDMAPATVQVNNQLMLKLIMYYDQTWGWLWKNSKVEIMTKASFAVTFLAL